MSRSKIAFKMTAVVLGGLMWCVAIFVTARAQGPAGQQKGKGGGGQVQPIQQLKPGLFMVAGAGGTSLVRVTNQGIILVDGKQTEQGYDGLMEQIKSVTSQPVKILIVTHHHADHTGNNQKFLDAGVTVIGTEDLKKDLLTYTQVTPVPAPPNVTYDKDYTARLGGVEVQLHHFGRAHTNGDTVVYYPDLKVVAVSDVIAAAPLVDYVGGGSAIEWSRVLDSILKLDFDTAIPGVGKPMTKAEVQEFKNKYDVMIARIKDLVKQGVPKDQLAAQIKTGDDSLVPRIVQPDGFYDEFSKAR